MKTANRDIDRGLVLHLPLNEGAGSKVYDRSPYGNHGEVSFGGGGAGAFWANTYLGKPVGTFDGAADRINVLTSTSLPTGLMNTGEWAVSCWAWRASDAVDASTILMGIYHKPTLEFSSSALTLRGIVSASYTLIVSYPRPSNEEWHHIIWQQSNERNISQILLNGALVKSEAFTQLDSGANRYQITGQDADAGRMFKGYLSDYRIYDRALSEQEARSLCDMRRRL